MRTRLFHWICLVSGAAAGLLFGDRLFPQLEAFFGDPIIDIFLGLIGLILAAVAYETVAAFARPANDLHP